MRVRCVSRGHELADAAEDLRYGSDDGGAVGERAQYQLVLERVHEGKERDASEGLEHQGVDLHAIVRVRLLGVRVLLATRRGWMSTWAKCLRRPVDIPQPHRE